MKCLRALAVLAVLATVGLRALASDPLSAGASQPISNPWFLQGELTTSDGAIQLGYQVSISKNTIVSVAGGAVYVYVKPAGRWINMTQTAKLTASDGSSLFSVAISGNTIVAGSNLANNSTGAAYVFVEPSGGWTDMTETAKLTASDAMEGNFLGISVAIAANTIVVGAGQNNSIGVTFPVGAGAAYVFVKPAGGWSSMTETAKLTASDGVPGDDLGWSVAVLGDTIVAGAPNATINGTELEGAVYVYQRNGATWHSATETGKLTASNGQAVSVVGFDVSISGNTIATTAFDQVYVFVRPAGGWTTGTQTAELKDPSGFTFDVNSAAICSKYVLAGDPMASNHPVVDLYVEPSTGWANAGPAFRFRVPADNGDGEFGWSAAIEGATLVIGSPLNAGINLGGNIIYVYGPA